MLLDTFAPATAGFSEAAAPALAEYNMRDQVVAMDALYRARRELGMMVWQLEEKSGVSFNAIYAWHIADRYPQLSNLVAVAQTLGFEIVMRDKNEPTSVFDLCNMTSAMRALDAARRRLLISTKDIGKVSGVSMSSFYCWLRQERSPTLGRLIDLAKSLGFEIIMRKST